MYGAILGDIIGSPYEFDRGDKTKDFPLFSALSRFTDDTVMSVAVADALLYVGEDVSNEKILSAVASSMQHWGHKYPHVGYGGRFREWLKEKHPAPYGSFGNGSAMRVSSVGWLYKTIDNTRAVASLTAEVTHNHIEGIKGAEAVASAIFLARTGESKDNIKNYIESAFGYDLSRSLEDIRPNYHMDTTCQGSVPESITAFLESVDFEDAVRNAVSLGGDTDTIACIAGSIAEAYYGLSPEMESECLKRLPRKMKEVLSRFDKARGFDAAYENSTVDAAIRRFGKDNSTENKSAVLEAIAHRGSEGGHFLMPTCDVEIIDDAMAGEDYEAISFIEAYTSAGELFMGVDPEDNDGSVVAVKIKDLLSYVTKESNRENCLCINYANTFSLTFAGAESVLEKMRFYEKAKAEEKEPCHPQERWLTNREITVRLMNGVRYAFICSYDYSNYCELYHLDGNIYRVNFNEEKIYAKLCKVFPALRNFRRRETSKFGEWDWFQIDGSCVLFIHDEVIEAYRQKTGYTKYMDWQPSIAVETICELSTRSKGKFVLKHSMLPTDDEIKIIRFKEDFLSDGRSYVSEHWVWDHITNVTYWFPADGLEESKVALEEYLISVGKLKLYEEHNIGLNSIMIQNRKVLSVTVSIATGDDEEVLCEAYM